MELNRWYVLKVEYVENEKEEYKKEVLYYW